MVRKEQHFHNLSVNMPIVVNTKFRQIRMNSSGDTDTIFVFNSFFTTKKYENFALLKLDFFFNFGSWPSLDNLTHFGF